MIPKNRITTHPGKILKSDYLEYLDVSQEAFANHLGISRKHLNAIVNEKAAVTPEVAVRLASALNTSPEYWVNLQKMYELTKAQSEIQKSKLPALLPQLRHA